MDNSSLIRVALFCGGRGSATLIRNLVQMPSVELSLLVNAYDDGLSTGDLRAFIPGMLGPSDFRKNLSYIIDLYSEGQYALQKLIEYRLPPTVTDQQIADLRVFAENRAGSESLLPALAALFDQTDPKSAKLIKDYLSQFFAYAQIQPAQLKYADCSLGNLVFAGAYLASNNNFNQTNRKLAHLFGSNAKLVNVCEGHVRTLVALKENGVVLGSEAEIVGVQDPSPILEFFFIDKPLSREELEALSHLSLDQKRARLQARDDVPLGSAEAIEAIDKADIVIFGPGTQHSSLLPSYKIKGIGEALKRSPSAVKAFVVNLQLDHDIQSYDAQRLVDAALGSMGDKDNQGPSITHILYNANSQTALTGIRLPPALREAGMSYKGAKIIEAHFENPVKPGVHSGSRIVSRIFDLYYREGRSQEKETLAIYIDLVERSAALAGLIQEFSEVEWREKFEKVTLIVNAPFTAEVHLPPHLAIKQTSHHSDFSEVAMLSQWLRHETSDYLATLTGDGEYRLNDIFIACAVLNNAGFGAIYGSRNQSRHQFRSSLHAAYGEKTLLYCVSFLGAFLLSCIFALMYGRIFTDPLTGFRLYHRHKMPKLLIANIQGKRMRSAAAVTRELVRHGVEIGEVPVHYRTFRNFSKASWRLMRGLRNLFGMIG